MLRTRHVLAVLLVAAVSTPLIAQTAPTHREVISGRVTGDSNKVVVGAQIIATRAPDRGEFRTTTDTTGRYRIVVDTGTGDYLVHISMPTQPTWVAVRKRLTRAAPADSVFVFDAVLKAPVKAVQQLSAVTVSAKKPTPSRGSDEGIGPGVGASEAQSMGVAAALAPDQKGDLTATALTIPGFNPVAGGFSVLGLGASQNGATLNGMSFAGGSVPRDAQTTTTVSSSTYDASRGWFSGGQTQVNMGTGNIFSGYTAHVTLDAPALQYGDPVSARLGQQFTKAIASLGGYGITAKDKLTFNYGLDLTRQTAPVSTLTDLDLQVLQQSGVSRDSVARLLQLMSAAHIPATVAGAPNSRATNKVSFITRLNTPEYNFNTFDALPRAGGVILWVDHSQTDAAQTNPLTTSARNGQTASTNGQIQGVFSGFVTKDLLEDLHSSLTWSESSASPYLLLPSASVRVGSTFADGTPGISSLGFGGSSQSSSSKTFTWETQSETKFYAPGKPKHRVKINADIRFDATSTNSNSNADGSFSYNSLADLASNTPASFTRALNNPGRSGSVWNGYAAIGDYFRVTPALQVLYGARLEGNVFSQRPAYNPAVDAAFGARTDFAPNTMAISPRIGFTWNYPKKRAGSGMMFNQIGQFYLQPPGVLSGGFGEFRNIMPASLLSGASVNTGLPNGYRQVSCIGSAIPSPDWSSYLTSTSNIPGDCTGGAPASEFRDAAPSVQLIDKGYDAPRSWRGNLRWTSAYKKLLWSIEGIVAYNVNQSGQYDLNFGNAPRFNLSDEGRPVYVQPTSIVTSSGVASSIDARTNAAFGRVAATRSDLRSDAKQLVLTLSPDLNNGGQGRFYGSMSYALADFRQLQRGFDGSTFGSPIDRSWSRSDLDSRHAIALQFGAGFKYASVSLFSRLRSGLPFTPMIASDVNGDGLANDRAFIFDPAKTPDAQLAADTRALLGGATPNVRSCLTSQYGIGAARNSCEGPWTADLNAAVRINTYPLGASWRKFNISFNISNPLGGLDQLLHGQHLQGWGNPATPSPTLYYVRGFDAQNTRYLYTVNPRFGNTRATNNAIQAPFRVTLDVQLRYGPETGLQQLDRWLRPGRDMPGSKMTADDLKKRYARNVPDPYRPIQLESDSLLLTTDQARRIAELQKAHTARVDSVWTDLTTWMAGLPDRFDAKAVLQRQEATIDAVWEMGRMELQTQLPKVLSPVQLQILPGWSKSFYTSKSMKGTRFFSFGN